jgi:amino acid permease
MISIYIGINFLSSFALITNNMAGPAMMGLPNVFMEAGYLPSIACIIYVCLSSSICGTLLSETIASIPGNQNFTKNIEFSVAFHHYLGPKWYMLAESLFFMSCMSQACASLVVTAHTLDGFLASFVFPHTYALQI